MYYEINIQQMAEGSTMYNVEEDGFPVIKARPPPEDSREENETLTKLNCELCAVTGLSASSGREELS